MWWRFSAANDQTIEPHHKRESGLECKCKTIITTQKRDEDTWFLCGNKIGKKIMGRRKIHYNQPIYKNYMDCLECFWIGVNCESIGKALMLGTEKRFSSSGPLLVGDQVHLYWAVGGEWELTRFQWPHDLHMRFVVTVVTMGAGLLVLHTENLLIVHNCPPWMQRHYTSST